MIIDPELIKAERDRTGDGLLVCRRRIAKRQLIDAAQDCGHVYELRAVLIKLIEELL